MDLTGTHSATYLHSSQGMRLYRFQLTVRRGSRDTCYHMHAVLRLAAFHSEREALMHAEEE